MKNQQLIKRLRAGLKSDETGNKANSLIFLHRYGFNIPLTFLVTIRAHERYLKEGAAVLEELRSEVLELPDKLWAVRSSTTAEDSKEFSFAGQFQTLINVSGTEKILEAVKTVWDSASLLNDNEYLRRTGISAISCGVIIQEMIESKLAGVSFSRNPVTNQNEIVVEALEGIGEDLVQKGITPMRWRFRKNIVIEGNQHPHYFPVIRQVAVDTAKLRRYYGHQTDIEWVWDAKKVYYLQLREITGRKELNIYSNKMVKEMLPGQIKPLVWSVNIPLVNGTWISLLSEITGTINIKPEDLVKQFYYQIYLNVAVLGKIFNEFGMSAESLEQLMISTDNSRPAFSPGFKTLRHTIRIIRFVFEKLNFEKRFRKEYSELKIRCNEINRLLDKEFTPKSYKDTYEILFSLGKRLAYLNIVTPILMTMHNKRLKKRLARLHLDYENLDFRHDFPELLTLSPLPSIDYIRKEFTKLPDEIKKECVSFEKLKTINDAAHLCTEIERFIESFGHLSESGTDFSFPKWEEKPEMVFNLIINSTHKEEKRGLFTLDDLKKKGTKVNRSVRKVYSKAGNFKVYREQISSLYIYGYGLFRKLFLQLGKYFAGLGIIENENDIFYLSKDEIDYILDGHSQTADINYTQLIDKRKREMEESKDVILPPVIYGDEAPLPETGKVKNLIGTGTSSGTFTGTTRVVRKTGDFETVVEGDVLIIPFSDVSWTSILAKGGAIVSETGGMLSHCSIIAREMGIPAMVSVPNACALGSGLTVTVNGSNGILTVHDYE